MVGHRQKLILFIGKTQRLNPFGAFLFIDPKDDAILFVDQMAEGGVLPRARAPMRTPTQ
jgi:hypothetical protein